MTDPQDPIAVAQAAVDAADALVKASQTLVDNAHAQMQATPPTMTLDQYRSLVDHHAAVVGNAAAINQATSILISRNVPQLLASLAGATADLNNKMAVLEKIQNVLDTATNVLIAIGALATFAASPSLMTITAVVSAINDII
jgi:hypothetical protein